MTDRARLRLTAPGRSRPAPHFDCASAPDPKGGRSRSQVRTPFSTHSPHDPSGAVAVAVAVGIA